MLLLIEWPLIIFSEGLLLSVRALLFRLLLESLLSSFTSSSLLVSCSGTSFTTLIDFCELLNRLVSGLARASSKSLSFFYCIPSLECLPMKCCTYFLYF